MPRLKQILTTAVLLLLPAFSYAEQPDYLNDPTPQDIVIEKGKDKGKIKTPREMFPDVKAYYNGDAVYVDLFETGPATVFVVDSFGQVVSSVVSEGFEYESLSLPLPSSKGSYTIVIWGTYFYGEGTFYVN